MTDAFTAPRLSTALATAAAALQAMTLASSADTAARLAAARRFRDVADGLRGQADAAVTALGAVLLQGGPGAATALRLLAALGTPAATDRVLDAAVGGDLAVSQGALQALGQIAPDPANAERLLARWQTPLPPGVGFLLARAIAQQPVSPTLLDWADALLAAPPGTEYADVVLRGIGAEPGPAVLSWMEGLRSAKRAEVQVAAQGALLRAGQFDALAPLEQWAGKGKPALRVRALVWLYGAPFATVLPLFASALADASAALKQAALLGAPFVADPALIPQAAALLADPKPTVAHQAQAAYWLLTGSPASTDIVQAKRLAIQVAARLPPQARCLLGRPLSAQSLLPLLVDPSYAACADATLRLMCGQAPAFRPDADLIRNLDALEAWRLAAAALDAQMPPGGRWYAGRALL